MAKRAQPKHHFSPGVVANTAKWLTILITSAAALVSFLSDSNAIGLFGWVASEGLTLSDYVVRNVRVTPAHDTTWAIGDSVYLAALVTDKRGSALVGTTVEWTTLDPAVAEVDSTGIVVTRGSGEAQIVAAVRKYADTVTIVSAQRLTALRIDADSTVRIPEGDAQPVFAMALDARRHEILGLSPDWSSPDTAILRVDSLGFVTGVAPGMGTVTATLNGFTASAAVEVVPVPGTITVVGGDDQRARVGTAVPRPIVARVWSRGGTPLAGARVRFETGSDGASVTPDTAIADGEGEVRIRWTLGATPGRQSLRLLAVEGDGEASVEAEADPSPADLVVTAMADSLRARFGTELPEVIRIQARDSTGRVIPGLPVTWTTRDGGTVRGASERTDSLGMARATWTLGPHAGWQVLEAQVGNPTTIPPRAIRAFAEPGAVARAEIVRGADQRGTVGRALKERIVIRALDAEGNPVADVSVSVAPGAGTVTDSSLTTDRKGQAAISWTVGRTSGVQELVVRVAGVKGPLHVEATVRPLGPGNIVFLHPPATGVAGRALSKPMVVQVTDAYGNAVSDREVVFSGPAGIVNPQRAMTDDDGKAATEWTLGGAAGKTWLQAVVKGTKLKAVLRLTAK
jgi:hypothetical protein